MKIIRFTTYDKEYEKISCKARVHCFDNFDRKIDSGMFFPYLFFHEKTTPHSAAWHQHFISHRTGYSFIPSERLDEKRLS